MQIDDARKLPSVEHRLEERIGFVQITDVPDKGRHRNVAAIEIRAAALEREISEILRAAVNRAVFERRTFNRFRECVETLHQEVMAHAFLGRNLQPVI